MKRFSFVFIMVLFSFLNSQAEELEPMTPAGTISYEAPLNETPSNSNFMVGLRTVYFDYEEPDVMTDRGMLTGIAGNYFYRWMDGGLLRLDGEYLSGQTNYEGALQDGYGHRTPYSSKENFRVMNFSGVSVFSTNFTESFVTAPFLGLGYRNTLDSKDGPYDYTRDITYYYLIYGAQFEFIRDPKKVWLLSVEFDTLLGGQAMTHLSDVSSQYPDMNLKFRSGSAYKIGLEFFYELLNAGKLAAEVSYKKWSVAESEPYPYRDSYFIEPQNTTALTSLTIGYLF